MKQVHTGQRTGLSTRYYWQTYLQAAWCEIPVSSRVKTTEKGCECILGTWTFWKVWKESQSLIMERVPVILVIMLDKRLWTEALHACPLCLTFGSWPYIVSTPQDSCAGYHLQVIFLTTDHILVMSRNSVGSKSGVTVVTGCPVNHS